MDKFTTQLVHLDRLVNQPPGGGVHSDSSNSVLFAYQQVEDLVEVFQGKQAGHVYSRSSSPGVAALQAMLTRLERVNGALVFSSGMAAISATLLSLLKTGDHVIASQFLFGNTRSLMDTLQDFGIEVSLVDVTDAKQVAAAARHNTRAVFSESIANPVTQVADLAGIGQLCADNNWLFLLDNTMTPINLFDAKSVQASLILCSLTKYLAGHGNVLGGAVLDTGLYNWQEYPNILPAYQVADVQQWGLTQIKKRGLRDMGGTLSADGAHRISVGLETLSLRMQRTCDNALALANWLSVHPKIARVYYPGLAEHPQHQRACQLFNGFGGMLSFDLLPEYDPLALLNDLKWVLCATHLGDTRTLGLPVAQTIFYENGASARAAMGISDNLIRLSVGIEDSQDLLDDFAQALEKI